MGNSQTAFTQVPLSVLDLAPITAGSTPAQALANSTGLAQHVEGLGYHRMWVAEHHNMVSIASSSPAVLIAHLAAHTSKMRLGSGGVMLPNHAALAIAEQFGMLEALHPGRIDLGIGRAPGTDPVTAAALRRIPAVNGADDFPDQLRDLLAYFDGDHPRITAMPGRGYRPELHMLGSSDYSAQVAGILGVGFAFAHHFASPNTMRALEAYRSTFQPGRFGEQPRSMIVVPVICAATTAEAERISVPSAVSFVKLRQGHPTPLPSPEDAATYEFSAMERELLRQWDAPLIKGDPSEVRSQLEDLIARTRVDEVMVTTMVHDHNDRLRSYQLLAEAWGLGDAETPGVPATRYAEPSSATPTASRVAIASAATP
jgi:luciferase family oxidoreductase group 1